MIQVTFSRRGITATLRAASMDTAIDQLTSRFGLDGGWKITAVQDLSPVKAASPASPAPCAWCEAEEGKRTSGSHGICGRHFNQQLESARR